MTSFDPDDLVRWAETYGHPEEWAKRAQAAHARAERATARAERAEAQRDELRSRIHHNAPGGATTESGW